MVLETHHGFRGILILKIMKKLTTEEFIEKAKFIHGDNYDYSKVEYTKAIDQICIICPTHGEFYQRATDHKRGQGCAKCKGGVKYTQEEFITKSKLLYFYDNVEYDNINYINSRTKVDFICKYHGLFSQLPEAHLSGKNGCVECVSKYKANLFKDNIENIIVKVNIKHNNFYKYLDINNFENHKSLLDIVCPKHGHFQQSINAHLSGKGCYKCGREITEKSRLIPTSNLKENILNKHGIIYIYPFIEEEHKDYNSKITIICKKHGEFKQKITKHLQGHRCPKCTYQISKPEIEIQNYIKSLKIKFLSNKKIIVKPYELDIYIPDLNKAIEFNGMYWHYSPKYFKPGKHAHKSNLCREKGIRLLHIREDLWNRDKEKMKSVILKFLQV